VIVLPTGSVIGILGGGQLGRMLALSAAKLGMDVHIYTPETDSPASRVAARTTIGAFGDLERVAAFARQCTVVTYEFENVPHTTAAAVLDAGVKLYPGVKALEVAQDRVVEKTFLNTHACPTAAFVAIDSADDIAAALTALGAPALLKTRREGYDGKGQAWVHTAADAPTAWAAIGAKPAILEARVDFVREVSLIAARGIDGQMVCYPLAENVHEGGILRTSTVPATDSDAVTPSAHAMAERILKALDYVGVIGIELFVTRDGGLLVNEFAPRVHNSGHWTMDGCDHDQFDLAIRAVAGWPLPTPHRHADVVMHNLIGADVDAIDRWAGQAGAHLHLYGKHGATPGRKMGHVNVCAPIPA
jgi:5-(carboxyamino)imidazole ribonucleotide synthase